MSTAILIQVRLASTRLPGKALLPLAGVPLIERMVQRAGTCTRADKIVLVSSDQPEDAALAQFAADKRIGFASGPTDNIVARLLAGALAGDAHTIVRVWGDCPFFCGDIADSMLDQASRMGLDYVTNGAPRSVPAGLDCEVWTLDALHAINELADLDPKLREFPVEAFKQGKISKRWGALSTENVPAFMPGVHLTVDYAKDFIAAEVLWQAMEHKCGPEFNASQLARELATFPQLAHGFATSPRNIEYQQYLDKLTGINNGN